MVIAALVAAACGEERAVEAGSAAAPPAGRAEGGPLLTPEWKQGAGVARAFPVRIRSKAYAGGAVVTNHGTEPAVLERVGLLRPSRNLRLIGIFAGTSPRESRGGDERTWPPSADLIPPSAVRPVAGTVVPAGDSPEARLGVALLVAIRIPRPGRYTFRALRVDYRVGDRRYRVDVPVSYAICAPRNSRCGGVRPLMSG